MKIRFFRALAILPVFGLFTGKVGWASASAPGDVPFEQYLRQQNYGAVETEVEHGYQVFHAKINGQDVRLELISEDAFTCLSRNAAWNLGLKIQDTGEFDLGMDGRQFGLLGIAPIAGFTVQNWAINRASDIKVLPRRMRMDVDADGGLGFDFLKLNNAIVMAGRAGFLIRPGILTPPPSIEGYMRKAGYLPVPLKIFHQRIVADGTLNGAPFEAMIDCNAAASCLEESFVSKMGIHIFNTDYHEGFGNGEIPLGSINPQRLTLGHFQAPSQKIYTAVLKGLVESEVQAIIGKDFFQEHEAIIDCGSSTLWLK